MFIYTNNFPVLEEDIWLINFKKFILDENMSYILTRKYIIENQDYDSAYELDKKYKVYGI